MATQKEFLQQFFMVPHILLHTLYTHGENFAETLYRVTLKEIRAFSYAAQRSHKFYSGLCSSLSVVFSALFTVDCRVLFKTQDNKMFFKMRTWFPVVTMNKMTFLNWEPLLSWHSHTKSHHHSLGFYFYWNWKFYWDKMIALCDFEKFYACPSAVKIKNTGW